MIKLSKIKDVYAREILDSRGNPTVEVEITLNSGIKATASVPSGASVGKNEALELRDLDKNRYNGKGVLKAVNNVNTIIKNNIVGFDSLDQSGLDNLLIKLDATNNKSNLGANAILGVSLANLKAASMYSNKKLYNYIGNGKTMPKCMMNILNGGVHASNDLDIQEFMIIPAFDEYLDNLRMGAEVFHSLKEILKSKNLSTSVGDEGGFAPLINTTKEALDLIKEAISKANYVLGKDIFIALDVAASEFYKNGIYYFEKKEYTSDQLIEFYKNIIDEYHIISIEDPMSEDDYDGWQKITKILSNIQLVGDDLFVTNKKLLEIGIQKKMANAILIKLNQIGSYTETLQTIKLAQENG